MSIASLLESTMALCFGLSWPISIRRMYTSWSTGGKSIVFDFLILFGYLCGIGSKLVSHNYNLAMYLYILNAIMVSIDTLLWFRNRRYETTGVK